MRTKFLLCLFVFIHLFCGQVHAASPAAEGAKAYSNQNYVEAAQHFTKAVQTTPSAEAYYNLGNANYRLKQYPQAALAYLRALRIEPSHDDARFNLQLTQQKVSPGQAQQGDFAWENPFVRLLNCGDVKYWTLLSFVFLLLMGIFWTVFCAATSHKALPKVTFVLSLLCGIAFLTTTCFAALQRYRYGHNDLAVIVAEEAQTYASPMHNAKKEILLPSGCIVELQDTDTKGWTRVLLADGTETWLETKGLERVSEKK